MHKLCTTQIEFYPVILNQNATYAHYAQYYYNYSLINKINKGEKNTTEYKLEEQLNNYITIKNTKARSSDKLHAFAYYLCPCLNYFTSSKST